jgi:hypothetical protein
MPFEEVDDETTPRGLGRDLKLVDDLHKLIHSMKAERKDPKKNEALLFRYGRFLKALSADFETLMKQGLSEKDINRKLRKRIVRFNLLRRQVLDRMCGKL